MPVADSENLKQSMIEMVKTAKTDIDWYFTVSGNYTEYAYQWYNSDGNALTNSAGSGIVLNDGSRLKATLMAVDITRNTDSYKLKITAKKTIGGVGEKSWEDYGELTIKLVDAATG